MIDRLFAMWQAIYPNSYISNEASQVDTFTVNKGQVQGPDSPLTPFHRDTRGTFWTCASSRNTKTFNYVYPDSNADSATVRGYVNRLYGPNASATAGSITPRVPKMAKAKSKRAASASASPEPGLIGDIVDGITAGNPLEGIPDIPTIVTTANNGSTYQYIANIQTTRFKLDGSYTVYVFFGDPDSEHPSTWGTAENMVGSYGVFSMPGMAGSDLVTTSTVPLTDALTSAVAKKTQLLGPLLQTLEQIFVVPFLEQNLHWRVMTGDGQVVDPDDVPDFKVSVVSSTMTMPDDPNAFPTWSEFNTLTQITRGKKGGLEKLSDLNLLGKRDAVDKGVRHPEVFHEYEVRHEPGHLLPGDQLEEERRLRKLRKRSETTETVWRG